MDRLDWLLIQKVLKENTPERYQTWRYRGVRKKINDVLRLVSNPYVRSWVYVPESVRSGAKYNFGGASRYAQNKRLAAERKKKRKEKV